MTNVDITSEEDKALLADGYQPQLRRSLGAFSAFAFPFSVISMTTGIFANYGFVLNKAGPFGFWTWLLVAVGHGMVALIFAELAGRYPFTGSVYNWNTHLGARPLFSWMAGWLTICNYTIATAAVTVTMIPIIGALLNVTLSPLLASCVATVFILIQLFANLGGVRLTSSTNTIAVGAEIAAVVILSVVVLGAAIASGQIDLKLLTTVPSEPRPYWSAFLMASLLGAWCLLGFESASDISEEINHAKKNAPFGILSSFAISVVVGFVFIVAMTISIHNLEEVKQSPYPISTIATHYIGEGMTKVFLVAALIAMFACSMVCMAAGSRVIFAMARDGQIVGSTYLKHVSEQRVPRNASVLISIVAIGLAFMADAATSLYGAATVCAVLCYLITVVSYARSPKVLSPGKNQFSLGRGRLFVTFVAIVWLVIEVGVLTLPSEFLGVGIASLSVVGLGLLLYYISRYATQR